MNRKPTRMLRMPSRMSMGSVAAVLMCVPLLLRAQTPLTPSQQQNVDNYRLYSAFFSVIKVTDLMADKAEARGKDPRGLTRKTIQTEARLTDTEYGAVRAAALDSNAQVDLKLKQQQEVIQPFIPKVPGGTNYPPDVGRQVANLQREMLQIVLDHIQQIKTALGDTRFQRFDQYVRTSIGPHLGSKTPPNKQK